MGYQGTRRAGGPGTGPQPVAGPGSGPQPVMVPGSGPQPVIRTGTGAQPVIVPGTGAQPVIGTGSGAQPAVMRTGTGTQPTLARTPVRGFPPAPPGRGQAPDAFSPAPRPAAPPASEDSGYADGFGYAGENGDGRYPPDEPDTADAADPADAAAPAAPGTRRHGPRTAGSQRRFPRVAWLAAACVVVAAGGFAGYKYLYEPRVNAPVSPTLRLPTTVAASSGFDRALGKWQHIGTRTEDPDPLTVTALYPPQFQLDGISYTRTAADSTKNCALVVYGGQLQAALQSGDCSQVLRASYISGDGTMMGTIGVVNLSSSSAAQAAGQVTGPQEIIAPLTGQKGPTSKLGNGTGVVQAEIKGHYLILMWAEFTDLKSPSTSAQKQQLEQFATALVTGSANIDLSTRMLTGKG